MVFSSFTFAAAFLPAVVLMHALAARRPGARLAVLLSASIVFYALSSWQTLPLLLGSLLWNAGVARQLVGTGARRRAWLIAGLAGNIGALIVAKYTAFGAENLELLFGVHLDVPAFALPLGISFFTLQQVMYLVDCYEGLTRPIPLGRHALILTLFPAVSAGPIVKVREIAPQLDGAPSSRLDAGLARFALGLGKKVLIADLCGRLVDPVFGSDLPIGLVDGWIASLAFTVQLYFDFSGYCDMALGIGLMLGIRLPENFDAPLRSTTVVEFWTRWHVTLSKFITTYLYTPVVRASAPVTFPKAMAATVLVMTLAGLWHGPAWTFVVFGVAHGVAMVTNHVWKKRKRKLPRLVAQVATMLFVNASFVVFRAASLDDAWAVLFGMSGLGGLGGFGQGLSALTGPDRLISLVALAVGCGVVAFAPSTTALFSETSTETQRWRYAPSVTWVFVTAVVLWIAAVGLNASATSGFIYRDF